MKEPATQYTAARSQPAGRAATIAISSTSGGIGKNDDSVSATRNSAVSACGVSAHRSVQS